MNSVSRKEVGHVLPALAPRAKLRQVALGRSQAFVDGIRRGRNECQRQTVAGDLHVRYLMAKMNHTRCKPGSRGSCDAGGAPDLHEVLAEVRR